MSRYVLSHEALQELDEIWSYIAKDNPDAADQWIATLFEACEKLARHPRMGHARPEITDQELLFWPIGQYLIIYRIASDRLEVVAITQGSRDMPPYLRQRG